MNDSQNTLESLTPLFNWLKKHFNLHRFLWLLAIILFMVAWNRGLALLYGMFALVLGVLCLSYIYPLLFLRDVKINRKQKTVVKVGEKLKLEYQIQANRELLYIDVCDSLPFNFEKPEIRCFLPMVPPEYRFEVSVDCELRGLFELDEISIESSYPFGVFSHVKMVKTNSSPVLVLPKTFPINSMLSALYSRQGVDGHVQSVNSGFYHELSGLREYRFGDSLKHIHWASTARHQEVIIKEFESFDRPTILIVLDQNNNFDVGELPESTFEFAVQIAASVIEYAIENNVGVYVYGKGLHETNFNVMPGALGSREFMENLALLKSDGDIQYDEVLNQALMEYSNVNSVMTFTNRSAKYSEKIPSMIDNHITHLDIEMVDQSFLYPLNQYQLDKAVRRGNRITWGVSRLTRLEELFAS